MIQSIGNKVIVEKNEKSNTSVGGIILTTNDEADTATVVSVGRLVDEVVIGDVVLVNWNKATKVGDNSFAICIEDVIGIIE